MELVHLEIVDGKGGGDYYIGWTYIYVYIIRVELAFRLKKNLKPITNVCAIKRPPLDRQRIYWYMEPL